MAYGPALELQRAVHAGVVEARGRGQTHGPWPLLLVEHAPPVITVSRRAGALANLVASPETLARMGVEVAETDRGGDITWHGPGQLVAYPIVDLQALGLGIHAYIRVLEDAAIRTCAGFGVEAHREPGATGVWCGAEGTAARKICAIGVRVSRWVAMHGLALNVRPDLAHFDLIVPCGLHGRAVTSLEREAPSQVPDMEAARRAMAVALEAALSDAVASAAATRPSGQVPS